MKHKQFGPESGIATLIALLLVGMLTMIGLAAMSTSDDEVTIAGNELREMRAFYASEAGLEMAAASLQHEYETTGMPPTTMPAGALTINNCVTSYGCTDNGPAAQATLSSGNYSGLYALVKTFSMTSTGTDQSDHGVVQMSQTYQTADVPIFQWAVFYEDDLWVEPVYDMNIEGRLHANGDIRVRSAGSGATFLFEDRVTCAGDIIHGFPWATSKGDVRFTNTDGTEVSMNQAGTWIDSQLKDWYTQASTLWGGNVRDQAFGQEELNLPLANSGDPHKMIERASGNSDSYENKAEFKIIDGVPYQKLGGLWQDVSASIPAGVITAGSTVDFFDAKEKEWVRNTQIDVSQLMASGYFPSNGIIYVSDQRSTSGSLSQNGLVLVNGSDLDANPMTVACENPVYVQGDFNTVDKQPAAVLSDAITLLSNSWDMSKAVEYDASGRSYTSSMSAAYYSKKVPSKTEMNLSFITGDTKADVSSNNHGGGLENLPRFLENWKSTEIKLRGSMIQMWESGEATGEYTYGKYFTAPTRNWGFDTDLSDPNKLPPGTPKVRVFQRIGWKQGFVAYGSPDAETAIDIAKE